jgi:hypothetical protein
LIFPQDLLIFGKLLRALSKASRNFCACLLAHIRPIYKLLLVADTVDNRWEGFSLMPSLGGYPLSLIGGSVLIIDRNKRNSMCKVK